ncbi:MAG: acyltransferase [Lachnospiraceae bacterium]|nr:acyltransferase [Lachnospiraceae bacterium]
MLYNPKDVKVRDSSIELLRIISMIMIVFHHFAVHGGFEWKESYTGISRFWHNFITMGGKIGVNVFILISGYYLINSKANSVDIKRVIKFWGQVFFYSVIIFTVFGALGVVDVGAKSIIKACFPITFLQWGFASTYFVLYLLHPFLNKFLHSMDKGMYQKFIILIVVCRSIIPTITTVLFETNLLLWFIILYSIAGYIRLYVSNNEHSVKYYVIFLIFCSIVTYYSTIVYIILGSRWDFFASNVTYFYGEEKITTLLISVSLLMIFVTLKMKYNKWINIIASATFGVFLIHDNNIIRPLLWGKLFNNARYQESALIIPYSIMAVAVVYIVCTLIDLLRQQIIEKPVMKIVDCNLNKITTSLARIYNVINNFIFGKD